jgi:hypothetical protein
MQVQMNVPRWQTQSHAGVAIGCGVIGVAQCSSGVAGLRVRGDMLTEAVE